MLSGFLTVWLRILTSLIRFLVNADQQETLPRVTGANNGAYPRSHVYRMIRTYRPYSQHVTMRRCLFEWHQNCLLRHLLIYIVSFSKFVLGHKFTTTIPEQCLQVQIDGAWPHLRAQEVPRGKSLTTPEQMRAAGDHRLSALQALMDPTGSPWCPRVADKKTLSILYQYPPYRI